MAIEEITLSAMTEDELVATVYEILTLKDRIDELQTRQRELRQQLANKLLPADKNAIAVPFTINSLRKKVVIEVPLTPKYHDVEVSADDGTVRKLDAIEYLISKCPNLSSCYSIKYSEKTATLKSRLQVLASTPEYAEAMAILKAHRTETKGLPTVDVVDVK